MFLIPGQQVRTASRRRLFGPEVKAREAAERRVAAERNVAADIAREPKQTKEAMPYGPWVQPFGGMVVSYQSANPLAENEMWKMSTVGLSAFVMLAIGVLSYSWVDALLLHGVAWGVEEWFDYQKRQGKWPWYMWHLSGHGISHVTGWQGGYLLAQMLFKGWNWSSLGGVIILVGYTIMYLQGLPVGHAAHFGGLAAGFVTGLGLKWYGPKRRPVAFLAKHSGKVAAGIVGSATLLHFYTKKIWPDPPGYKGLWR